MAKATSSRKPANRKPPKRKKGPASPSIQAGFEMTADMARLFKEGALLVLAVLAFYLFLGLISYTPKDPGPFHLGGQLPVANWGGSVGAWVADLLFNLFGKMAYFLVLLLVGFGWRLLKLDDSGPTNITLTRVLSPVLGFVMAMMGACGIDHLYFDSTAGVYYTAGGIFGDLSQQAVVPNFGLVGATLILLGLFLIGVTMVTRLSWLSLIEWLGAKAFALWHRFVAYINEIRDEMKGRKERKRRTETVSAIREKITQKKPPKIAPKLEKPKVSQRFEKEKQLNLFESAGSGELPPLNLLDKVESERQGYSEQELEMMSSLLVKKLKDFKIDITVEAVQPGPVITRFEIDLAAGIKASQVTGLSRDLARALSVVSIRVVENIPGKPYMGIEIPNQSREIVQLLDVLSSDAYERSNSPLTIVLGKDIAGEPIVADLAKMPHVLVAGTTGSGKSVCINTLIMSMVFKNSPDQVRMIMIDPKMLELSVYADIPHLLAPVVTDMKKASNALHWCIGEMDRRFTVMAALGVRNLGGYNKKIADGIKNKQPIKDPLFQSSLESIDLGTDDDTPDLEALPHIVVIVDELADLMMITKKKIEEVIIRIAQRARAAGIHLVLATQRPSVDVVTGLIKANVPTRIAFQVSSRADSRTVLDQMGAEQLLGQGDMLFLPPGMAYPQRVHGAFVSDEEVKHVTEYLRRSAQPVYIDEITDGDFGGEGGDPGMEYGGASSGNGEEADELYDRAVYFVTKERKSSISAVQRYLRVGYNRAARMVESMEAQGVVGPLEHGKREIMAPPPPEMD